MLKACGCIDMNRTGPVNTPMSDEQFAAWEAAATVPTLYDPPQKRVRCGQDRNSCISKFCTCLMTDVWYTPLLVPCPCIPPFRACCFGGLGLQEGSIESPDDWFNAMLVRNHPNCPEEFKGIWWMKDNVAAEGLFTLSDGDWVSDRLCKKNVRYNWTVDACNIWGASLTRHFWVRGGELHFAISPSRKWMQITMIGQETHFVYVIQPGDEFRRPDGSLLEVVPGEDLLRISYDSLKPDAGISYLYITRRVAKLDGSGNLVKTASYDELLEASRKAKTCCPGRVEGHIMNTQAFTLAPMPEARSKAPAQEAMAEI